MATPLSYEVNPDLTSVKITANGNSISLDRENLQRWMRTIEHYIWDGSRGLIKDAGLPYIDNGRIQILGDDIDLRELLNLLKLARDDMAGVKREDRLDMTSYKVTPVGEDKEHIILSQDVDVFVGRFPDMQKAMEYYIRKTYRRLDANGKHIILKVAGPDEMISKSGDRYKVEKIERRRAAAKPGVSPEELAAKMLGDTDEDE